MRRMTINVASGTFCAFLTHINTTRRPLTSAGRYRNSLSEHSMLDVVVLAIGAIFFALSIAYVYACDLL